MEAVSLGRVARSSFYLYLSTLISSILGYVFWLAVSKLTTPEVVGLASATVSFAVVLGSLTHFGIPAGIQRFFGKAYAEGNLGMLKAYLSSGFTVLILAAGGLAFSIVFLSGWLAGLTSIPIELLAVAGLLILTRSVYPLFYALFISTLKTNLIMYVNTGASTLRLIVGILLVLFGFGALGIILGYFTLSLTALIAYSLLTLKTFGLPKPTLQRSLINEIFKAGSASWIPSIIQILGTQLGVLMVYGFVGALEAGQYFIAYAIASVVWAIPQSFLGVMFPVLSGMGDGRKRASWRAVRLTLAVTVPIAVILAVYARVALAFFGLSYAEAWPTLTLLLAGVAPLALPQGVSILAYSYGFYSLVLTLGLTISIPRVLLYFLLTPMFGGFGAAEAFTAGTFTAILGATVMARRMGLTLNWRAVTIIFLTPIASGLASHLTSLPWPLGTPLILAASLLTYARLKIVTLKDLAEIGRGFLPEKLYRIGVERLSWIIKILYGES